MNKTGGQDAETGAVEATLAGFVEALQQEEDTTAAAVEEVQVVVFELDGDEYAVAIQCVREILRVPEISRIPHAPRNVRGVINVRGQILPVLELRGRLGLPRHDLTAHSRILVVESGGRVTGLLVDRVSHVLRVPEQTWVRGEKLPSTTGDAVSALAQLDSRLIILLDLERVLWTETA